MDRDKDGLQYTWEELKGIEDNLRNKLPIKEIREEKISDLMYRAWSQIRNGNYTMEERLSWKTRFIQSSTSCWELLLIMEEPGNSVNWTGLDNFVPNDLKLIIEENVRKLKEESNYNRKIVSLDELKIWISSYKDVHPLFDEPLTCAETIYAAIIHSNMGLEDDNLNFQDKAWDLCKMMEKTKKLMEQNRIFIRDHFH